MRADVEMDVRGVEVDGGLGVGCRTYYNRVRTIYDGRKDFYALDYDMDEVIDAVNQRSLIVAISRP